jgi:alpha-mannosidase
MVADKIATTCSNEFVGEILTEGRVLDREGQIITRYTQAVRVLRGLPAAIVSVQLDPVRLPDGDAWNCYFASRLAWSDESVSFRRGVQWMAKESTDGRIISPEWVEISSGETNIVCLSLGLPYHRQAGPTWLDTLLVTPGSDERHFQFTLALDCTYPTQTALALLTAAAAPAANISREGANPRGWFLHIGSSNVLMSHLSALEGGRGIRCRLLETEGRSVETSLAAFRAFKSARSTDFLGNLADVLSVVDGKVEFHIAANQWIQIEAEW